MSGPALLSEADIERLTGLVQPAAQIRALRKLGLRPVIRADGKPVVTVDAVTRINGGAQDKPWSPDLSKVA